MATMLRRGLVPTVFLVLLFMPRHGAAESITNNVGEVYADVKVISVTPKDLLVSQRPGGKVHITTIPLASLPPDVQAKYGYTPDKESAYKEKVAADDAVSFQRSEAFRVKDAEIKRQRAEYDERARQQAAEAERMRQADEALQAANSLKQRQIDYALQQAAEAQLRAAAAQKNADALQKQMENDRWNAEQQTKKDKAALGDRIQQIENDASMRRWRSW